MDKHGNSHSNTRLETKQEPLKDMESSPGMGTGTDTKDGGEEVKEVWFCQMFRFATSLDYLLMGLGTLGACAMGVAFPAFAFIWGDMIDNFEQDPNLQASGLVARTRQTMFTFIYVGIGAFFAGWLMFAGWMITGERQGIACRKAYLRSLLKQEIGWFDLHNQSELASQFATDTFAFSGAIGEKVSSLIMTASTMIAGFIFAFITGWLMTLVLLATIPALLISGYFYMQVITEKDKEQQKNYLKAGGRAEQAITSIKTVKQLSGEGFESAEYEGCLREASKKGCKYACYEGLGIAGIFFVMLASYSLGFWYGSRCVLQAENCRAGGQQYSTGDVLVIFFSILMAGFNLGQLTPAFKKIAEGKQAAGRIFALIDREPLIRSPEKPVKIERLEGRIMFENVTFYYPKDPSRMVLRNLNLQLDINRSGLVGESGCGKSTVLQLIMRFYDPIEGRVTLDGVDLKDLDLVWLREQIGYVGQEPVLFATSIRENLLFGNENATESEIESAIRQAEAHTFVNTLEKKLDTFVGEGGGQLSGGQKQRIAIARAILRKPKILLLDEATSALDRRNEKLIQNTLDTISTGRTTITIAHRVKTIMGSDIIYVFDKGGVKEKGRFEQLSLFKGMSGGEEEEGEEGEEYRNGENDGHIDLLVRASGQEKGPSLEELEKLEYEERKKGYEKGVFRRIFKYSSTKIPLFVLGIVMALANGVIFPVFSIFLARMFVLLLEVQFAVRNGLQVESETVDEINLFALIFLLLGVATLVLMSLQIMSLSLVGEEITRRIRIETFDKILRMPVRWFDRQANSSGALTTRLSSDCQAINSMTTTVVSIKIQNLSTLLSAIIIGFVFEWRTTLVALALLPLMIICGVIQMAFSTGFSDTTDEIFKDSVNLITESMANIRTVSSFGYESIISKKYDEKMEKPLQFAITKGNASGFFFGLSQIILFTIFGVLFWLGSIFVRDNPSVSIEDMFVAVFAILFAGMTAGNNAHFIPDEAACRTSAINLFIIQDSTDEQQQQERDNSRMLKEGINGDILLQGVDFRFYSRNEYVFKDLNLRVGHGSKVAFVGTSGCGKSTIMQLLQRFYDPDNGTITINDIPIKDFDLHYLRTHFGVVSQEPVLFNGSFNHNIRYNLDTATQAQIVEAAAKANALSFIEGKETTLDTNHNEKTGFNRSVGVKGSHISGGQKQRVAIARTILRNPSILLLDEATSALDAENERKVQESLDNIMKGKTVVSIAHRMETIKNSDKILMFEKGKIVEEGTYQTLLAQKGYFYNLERGAQFT